MGSVCSGWLSDSSFETPFEEVARQEVLSAAIRGSLSLSSNAEPIRPSAIQTINSCVLIPSARAMVSAKLSFPLWTNP
jgi:hypothetical protein